VNLGANVPATDVAHAARAVHADIVCLSATTERASAGVIAIAREFQLMTDSPPPVILGGGIASHRGMVPSLPVVRVVSGSAVDAAERIDALSEGR
jgi:methanogenic corrinoid protein MtbC1